jgi:hypothetical protein
MSWPLSPSRVESPEPYRPLSPPRVESPPPYRPPAAPRPPYVILDDESSDTETLGSQDTLSTIFDPPQKRLRASSDDFCEQVFLCNICQEVFSIGQFTNCRNCSKTVCDSCLIHTRYVSGLGGLCAFCRQSFGDCLPDEEDTEDTESEYRPSVASEDLED